MDVVILLYMIFDNFYKNNAVSHGRMQYAVSSCLENGDVIHMSHLKIVGDLEDWDLLDHTWNHNLCGSSTRSTSVCCL